MSEAELRYQLSIVEAEKEGFEALNKSLISEVTRLEKKVTELHAQLKTAQTEKEGLKETCGKYQKAYTELYERLGTYDTQLIDKLQSRANRAESELRRMQSVQTPASPTLALQLQTALQAKAAAEATVLTLQSHLTRSQQEVDTLVDQLTTEIANSARMQEDFQALKGRYQALYRESRQDAVADPIPAPDPLDTPRLPHSSPALKFTMERITPRRGLCSLCGQLLPLQH